MLTGRLLVEGKEVVVATEDAAYGGLREEWMDPLLVYEPVSQCRMLLKQNIIAVTIHRHDTYQIEYRRRYLFETEL